MRRITLSLATATLAVAALAGCGGDGGDDTDAYCDSVKEASAKLEDKKLEDKADLQAAISAMKDVRDNAEGQAKKDWGTIVSAFDALNEGKVADIDEEAMQKALDDVEKNVKDECDIDLNELN